MADDGEDAMNPGGAGSTPTSACWASRSPPKAPSGQSYGRDMGLRDPFGNNIRIGTMNA